MEDPSTFRLTVVAADRPGLLADSAAALAGAGLTVHSASVATWTDRDIALHSMTVTSGTSIEPDWDDLGERLRSMATGPRPAPRYAPRGRATVTLADSGLGGAVVKVIAPDGLGLLEAISRWFAEQGVSIEAAEITTRDGVATDRFLVDGEFDPAALANHLSPAPTVPFDRFRLPASALVSVGRRVRPGAAR